MVDPSSLAVVYPISKAVAVYLAGGGGNYNGERYYGALNVVLPINENDDLADFDGYLEPIAQTVAMS